MKSDLAVWPRGLSVSEAAQYLGISRSTFTKLVAAKQMPRGKRISEGRLVWDRSELDHVFDHIDTDEEKEQTIVQLR